MRGHKTIAYVDGANLHNAIRQYDWSFDYARFRVWLREKYGADKAYLFLGLIPRNGHIYSRLQEAGFILEFKEVTYGGGGIVEGNCDADMIVRVMRDTYEHPNDQTVIITSDGDFTSLVKFLIEKKRIRCIVSPSPSNKCSILLKRTGVPISYLFDQRGILSKRKSPR